MSDIQDTHGEGATKEKKRYTVWIVVGVLVLLVLYGLQYYFTPERMIERALERETSDSVDVTVNPEDGQTYITYHGEDGDTFELRADAEGGLELPDTWPSSVPLVKDATLTYTNAQNGNESAGISLAYMTREPLTSVVDFYKNELTKNGWTIRVTSVTSDGGLVSATKGDTDSEGVMVVVGASPEGTTVTLSVSGGG